MLVNQGSMVVLDGRSSYSPNQRGYISAYRWAQIPAPGIPIIPLVGANTPTPSFIAPLVPQDTLLAFNLVVTDNNGATSAKPSTVYVLVKHAYTDNLGRMSIPLQGQQLSQPLPQSLQNQQLPGQILQPQLLPRFG